MSPRGPPTFGRKQFGRLTFVRLTFGRQNVYTMCVDQVPVAYLFLTKGYGAFLWFNSFWLIMILLIEQRILDANAGKQQS